MYLTGRSAKYSPDGQIEIVERTVPDPGPDEIQLKGAVCGICSWDIATCRLVEKMGAPAPPGHEGIGYVTAVGTGVSGYKTGDRVACGGFQTLANVRTDGLHRLPSSELADEYWLVKPLSCVVTGVDVCHLRPGDRVAVVGCGFMGLMLIQVLSKSYALEVIGLDIDEGRLAMAERFGADETYDLTRNETEDLVVSLNPRQIDIVMDTSGSQHGLDLAARLVKRGGMINLFGWIKGNQATFDPTIWHLGGFTVVNSGPAARLRDTYPTAIDLIESGKVDLQPLVSHVVDLDDYPTLMKQILSGDADYLKGVVRL